MLDIPIHTARDQKVILDSDLAKLYEVTTKRLNEQVKRNQRKFPESFRFQLSEEEWGAEKADAMSVYFINASSSLFSVEE